MVVKLTIPEEEERERRDPFHEHISSLSPF
jgi:hypothetical protein